ncbi:hypothetical protein KU40_02375 [Clostridium botulinum]|nr:hypothetical protein KU40_02375 [Clostridium botulinum]
MSNIMTQPDETTKFKVSHHIKVLKKYGGKDIVNYVVVNVGAVENYCKEKYILEDAELVKLNSEAVNNLGIKIIGEN